MWKFLLFLWQSLMLLVGGLFSQCSWVLLVCYCLLVSEQMRLVLFVIQISDESVLGILLGNILLVVIILMCVVKCLELLLLIDQVSSWLLLLIVMVLSWKYFLFLVSVILLRISLFVLLVMGLCYYFLYLVFCLNLIQQNQLLFFCGIDLLVFLMCLCIFWNSVLISGLCGFM